MEKQTMGAFISSLRKSKGITQKELAEMLNVSDKAVSRWECDQTVPDIMLILLIADIFNVTADELIRGARIKSEQPTEAQEKNVQKRLEVIFESKLKKYKTLSVIPLAVTFIGVIIGFICGSLTYYEVGIGISLAFFVCAAACQIVFLLNFKNSTDTNDLKEEISEKIKKSIFEFTFNTFTALLCIEALVLSADNSFLIWSGPALSIVIFLISFLVKSIIIKKNHVKSNDKEKKKAGLFIKVFTSFVCIIAILVSAMLLININSQSWIEKPKIFYVTDSTSEISDYLADSFRDYFDDDALLNHDDFSVKLDGKKIEFSDFIENELFIHGYSIDIIEKDGKECTRVKLWTRETFENSKNLIDTINGIFIVLYSVCIASAATVYFVKLKKIK